MFKDALQENKASFHPKNVVFSQTQCDIGLMDNVEVGYSTADRIFGKPRQTWPDGIVFIEDTMTMGAIAALNKHGVHIGRDVQIATHANTGSPLLIGARGSIVTIEFDPKQIVDAMYTTLESVMESKTTESSTHWIEPLLITRPSKSAS